MTGCGEESAWGPCVRHVTVAVSEVGEDGRLIEQTNHVAERVTLDPLGQPHTTYANSKWVKQWPVSPPTS